MHHADARRQRRPRLARRQRLAKDFDRAFVGRVMAEENIHEGGLARTVFAQQGDHLTAPQLETDPVIGGQAAKALGDAVEAQDNVLRRRRVSHQEEAGSSSLISTVNSPALIALVRSSTSAIASAGTLPSNVPSGASEQPPSFMKE